VSRYSHHDVNIDDLKYYCFWCSGPKKWEITYIEFDLALHILENHRMDTVKVPIGRGNMEKRIDYMIDQCKQLTLLVRANPEKKTEMTA